MSDNKNLRENLINQKVDQIYDLQANQEKQLLHCKVDEMQETMNLQDERLKTFEQQTHLSSHKKNY